MSEKIAPAKGYKKGVPLKEEDFPRIGSRLKNLSLFFTPIPYFFIRKCAKEKFQKPGFLRLREHSGNC